MTKAALGRGSVLIDGERFATQTFEFEGERFTVRELSVDEGDDIAEAVTGPGPEFKFNNRLNTRMLLSKALVEPVTSIDAVGKMPGRKYLTVLRAFNALNSLPVAPEVPTLPAGETEPEQPASGEPSPQP